MGCRRIRCPECGKTNNINLMKNSKDKLCTSCRAVIVKKGRNPNPKWEEKKARRSEKPQEMPGLTLSEMLMGARRGFRLRIQSENQPEEVSIE